MFNELIEKINVMHEELNELRAMVDELEKKVLPNLIVNDMPTVSYVPNEQKVPDYFFVSDLQAQ